MIIGGTVGCPVLGAVIGAGLASPAGIFAETQIADRLIDDPRVRADIQEANAERYIFETFRNMIAAGAASWLAGYLANLNMSQISSFFSRVAVKVVQNKGGNIATDFGAYCVFKYIINALRGGQIKSWEDAEKAFEKAKEEAGEKSEVPSTVLPIAGCKYAIKIWGTNSAFTCVDNTEMRLRYYCGSTTQRFRCTYYEGNMGFICEGADGGKGRYLGYDSYETLSCQAYYQRGWEHINVMSEEGGGYKLWMTKDDHFAPVQKVNTDTVKMMATSTTRVEFVKVG
ncbi:hypothetical protein CC80DRAFT_588534 [Byssothecium circinans]|uniref:Uncharacterized protein n=1 Tax=Byssothecium circinans TaxID=147558 RepID=A0A6A5UJH0_9PLEO|nr:hypothetical protein CC80DRAFT_588534 [Byssothecium circinans]